MRPDATAIGDRSMVVSPVRLSTTVSATHLEANSEKGLRWAWADIVATDIDEPGYFDTEHTTAVLPVTPSTNLCGQLTISRLQTSLTVVVRNALTAASSPVMAIAPARCDCSPYHTDQGWVMARPGRTQDPLRVRGPTFPADSPMWLVEFIYPNLTYSAWLVKKLQRTSACKKDGSRTAEIGVKIPISGPEARKTMTLTSPK
ncbi:hypothetical protein B0T20DRAFT_469203 [Sordaria brevicollis]|uniref:Uncharacterized protein n=1 Tax=Sordaria brevicollis TaxID=83679 RepID=A0AAE0PE87_SORBR|nr:hypothetical protein B0T20DRAFT_469203 [Sordaria brevicollis]